MRNMKERQPMDEVSYIRIPEEAKLIEQKKRLKNIHYKERFGDYKKHESKKKQRTNLTFDINIYFLEQRGQYMGSQHNSNQQNKI